MKKYKLLNSPLKVLNTTFKNRVVMMPMGTNFAASDGGITEKHKKYYELRAKGGAGFIIVENACVDFPMGSNGTTQLRIDHDQYIPGLSELVEGMHKYGCLASIQINHAGASASPERIGCTPASASTLPSRPNGNIPRKLTVEEIHYIANAYAKAAIRAKTAGFDSVEVHGGHSYLISQFLSPVYNDRTDEFGGTPENRARFARLVLEKVRAAVGPNYPISFRVSADEFMEGGNKIEDTLIQLAYLDEYIDIYDVSAALNGSGHYQIDAMYLQDGWRSFMAKAVKDKFNKPVITSGNYRNPQIAEDVLEKGDADFIGIGRGLIAEPEWLNKAVAGKETSIRKCISCNIGCAGNRIGLNKPIHCTVNPSLCEEYEYKVENTYNAVVIGGGSSGLSAACTLAESGCTTFVIEKSNEIGGLSRTIARLPDKKRIQDFPDYLADRCSKLSNLYILNNTSASIELIKKLKPNLIVNATGSVPLLPSIDGLKERVDAENSNIYSIMGLLNSDLANGFEKNKKVVVIGGGSVGLDVIEYFAHLGADMTIVEMSNVIGRELDPISKGSINEVLTKNNVDIKLSTKLVKVNDNSFTVVANDKTENLEFDYGFICLGMTGYNPILNEIEKEFQEIDIINIGDSKSARKIIDGVYEGSIALIEQLKKMDKEMKG